MHDFGFTFEDAMPLPPPVSPDAVDTLDKLEELILNFVRRLQESPEKETIRWPQRVQHMEALDAELASLFHTLRTHFNNTPDEE